MTRRPTNPAHEKLKQISAGAGRDLSRSAIVSVAASLLWLPQAAAVAWLFSALLQGVATGRDSLLVAVLFVALGVMRAALDAWSNRLAVRAGDRVVAQERRALIIAESRRAPLAGPHPASAEIAALAGEKLAMLLPHLVRYRPAYLRAAVVPLVILVVAAFYSWAVALVLLVAGPLIPVFMALVGMAAQDASERQMDEIANINTLLMERLRALIDIRLLDASRRMLEQFQDGADDLRSRSMAVLRVAFLSSTVLELFSALGVALVAVYVGFALLGQLSFGAYATPLSLGEGMFLLLLAPDFFQPLRDMAAAWHDKVAATAVARDLLALEKTRGGEILGTGAMAEPLRGAPVVAASGLRLRAGEGALIDYPDFTIPAGSSVAVTGPSGVGKSTLIAALGGLIGVERGHLTVAGQRLGPDNADAWRARLGWVPQAPHFFAGSLQSNIALSPRGRDGAALTAALSLADAKDIVARLDRGVLTRLGENGAGVSGGEARRLMVARAAYGAPDVILADEPTADLDDETAREVTDGLMALAAAGTTLIVATHDETLAARMERRIALEGGAG